MKSLVGVIGLALAASATAGDLNIPEATTPPQAHYEGVLHDEQVLPRMGSAASYWFSVERDDELFLFHSQDLALSALMAPGDSVVFSVVQDVYRRPVQVYGNAISVGVEDLLSVNGKEPVLQGRKY